MRRADAPPSYMVSLDESQPQKGDSFIMFEAILLIGIIAASIFLGVVIFSNG